MFVNMKKLRTVKCLLYQTLIHPPTNPHQSRGIANFGLQWLKNRTSTRATDIETGLRAASILKDAIKRLPSSSSSSSTGLKDALKRATMWRNSNQVAEESQFEALALPTSRELTPHHVQSSKAPIGMYISHFGVFVFALGVMLSNSMKVEFTQRLPLGSELNMGNERCVLRGLDHLHAPTFHSICGNLMILKPARENAVFQPGESDGKLKHFMYRWMKNHEQQHFCLTMFPEKRYYGESSSTSEVAIHTNLFTDLYATIGTGSSKTGGWNITIMKLPFIFLVFLGFGVASVGGLIGLIRQLRRKKLQW